MKNKITILLIAVLLVVPLVMAQEREIFTAIIPLIFLISLSIAWIIIWILTLVHQAKRQRWFFFALTIIFNITLIIYWIIWIFSPKFRRK